jgi:hypothetical protein
MACGPVDPLSNGGFTTGTLYDGLLNDHTNVRIRSINLACTHLTLEFAGKIHLQKAKEAT